MLTVQDVKKAMRMLEDPSEYLFCEAVHKQLARALELYEERGEYTGTLEEALECLERAAYEISRA